MQAISGLEVNVLLMHLDVSEAVPNHLTQRLVIVKLPCRAGIAQKDDRIRYHGLS